MPKKYTSNQTSEVDISRKHINKKKRFKVRKTLLFILLAMFVIISSGIVLYLLRSQTWGTANTMAKSTPSPFTHYNQATNTQQVTDHLKHKQLASLYVSHMSLNDKIAQLLMVEYRYATQYSSDLDTMLNQQHVGGVIMYREQINTAAQTTHDTAQMQQRSKTPVLIAVDEEGWNVDRLANLFPNNQFYHKSADDIRASGDPAVATSEGKKVAHDLLTLGINMNLAPDIDVSTDNNYIGYDARSFGTTPSEVIKYAGPYIKAMQADGVIGCIKHFPGIGSLPKGADPHMILPTLTKSKSQLFKNDIAPFTHFIQSTDPQEQVQVVMPTNVLVPSIDPTYPVEFSHLFITDILRKQLHFDGVILTDSLIMGGVQLNGQPLTLAQAGVLALQAGNDMLMGARNPTDVDGMIAAIKDALNDGILTKKRIDEAATRIIELKISSHLMLAN